MSDRSHRARPARRAAAALLAALVAAALAAAVGASGSTVDAAAPAFTASVTVARNHLVNGADDVVDTRSITVSVDQTRDLRERQEITVKWTGAHPTGGVAKDPNSAVAAEQEYPMVLMQCRRPAAAGAPITPDTCWTHTPKERFQSDVSNFPAFRMDRYAAAADRRLVVGAPPSPPAACSSAGSGAQRWVPFVGANGTVYPGGPPVVLPSGLQGACAGMPPEAVTSEQSLQPSNTTYAPSGRDGAGQAKFTIATEATNASLGCSDAVPCSLVIVPIEGISCDAAGALADPADRPEPSIVDLVFAACAPTGRYGPGEPGSGLPGTSDIAVSGLLWWSASNWRNRIEVPLDLAPSPDACSLRTPGAPAYMYGSEVMSQATQQWSPAFCLDPSLFKIQHVQTAEPLAKNLLRNGSIEAAIQAAPPPEPFPAPTVQAPIAVSGFAISYVIDGRGGQPYENLKLTPRLLAKLLTESYPAQPVIRDAYPALAHNPLNIAADPEFKALNPGVPEPTFYDTPAATLFTVSSDSDVITALTAYINADPAARAWLDGAPDPWGMTVNPAYRGIALPAANWPLLDTFNSGPAYDANLSPCLAANPVPFLPLVAAPLATMAQVTLNLQFGVANSQVWCADAGAQTQKLVAIGREAPGQRFLLGVTPLADAARYKLSTAALQTQVRAGAPEKFSDATGRTFQAPTEASLLAATALLRPDAAAGSWLVPYGAFQTDPAAAGAYPGTLLVSLDVATSGLSPAQAQRYATVLAFAAGPGQTPGSGNGELPPGYLPMTEANGLGSLVAYTKAAGAAVAAQSGQVPPVGPPPGDAGGGPGSQPSAPGEAVAGAADGQPVDVPPEAGGPAEPAGSAARPGAGGSSRTPAFVAAPAAGAQPSPGGPARQGASLIAKTLGFAPGFGGLALVVALAVVPLGAAAAALTLVVARRRAAP